MKELTFKTKQYFDFKDAIIYTFLQRKYQFKQAFSLASIREHINNMQKLFDLRLDFKGNKDIYDCLIALDDADVTIDTSHASGFDITIVAMDAYNKENGDLLATTICGFHYGEEDFNSKDFAFDNVATFDNHVDVEDK